MKISLKACEPHRYGLNCQQKFEIGHKLNYWSTKVLWHA